MPRAHPTPSAADHDAFYVTASEALDRAMPVPMGLSCLAVIAVADDRLLAGVATAALIAGNVALNRAFQRAKQNPNPRTEPFAYLRMALAFVLLPLMVVAAPYDTAWLPAVPVLLAIPFLAGARVAVPASVALLGILLFTSAQVGLPLTTLLNSGLGVGALVAVALPLAALMRTNHQRMLDLQTELEAARDRAEAASSAKSRFLAQMSHEIRTPLHGVIGGLSLVRNTADEAERDRLVHQAARSADGLLDLLNDILDLSRVESGHMPVSLEPTDLDAVLEQVRTVFGATAQQKGLTFTATRSPSLPRWGRSDSRRLRQVLFNLVGNAVKFTQSGTISVTAEPRGEAGVTLAVTDTGPGIPEAARDRIFHSFEQAGDRVDGTGLGLALVQHLAHALGGTVAVTSVVGQGSKFRVELPWPPAEAVVSPSASAALPAPGARVLVVEDHPVNQLIAQKMLESLGCVVTLAATGEDGVRLGQSDHWDAILMDIQLPGITGIEATRALRAAGVAAPIIALTAESSAQGCVECEAAGMNGVLSKPAKLADLAKLLHDQLAPPARAP